MQVAVNDFKVFQNHIGGKMKSVFPFPHYSIALRILSTSDIAQPIHQEPGYFYLTNFQADFSFH